MISLIPLGTQSRSYMASCTDCYKNKGHKDLCLWGESPIHEHETNLSGEKGF